MSSSQLVPSRQTAQNCLFVHEDGRRGNVQTPVSLQQLSLGRLAFPQRAQSPADGGSIGPIHSHSPGCEVPLFANVAQSLGLHLSGPGSLGTTRKTPENFGHFLIWVLADCSLLPLILTQPAPGWAEGRGHARRREKSESAGSSWWGLATCPPHWKRACQGP